MWIYIKKKNKILKSANITSYNFTQILIPHISLKIYNKQYPTLTYRYLHTNSL